MSEDDKEPDITDEEIDENLKVEAYLEQKEEEEGKWAEYIEAHPEQFYDPDYTEPPSDEAVRTFTGSNWIDERKTWTKTEEYRKPKLEDVYEVFRKWFFIDDTKRLDLGLAVVQNSKLEGLPLWVLLRGSSGDMKSTQLETLECDQTKRIYKFTARTLVTGKNEPTDLVQALWGKTILIFDLAETMSKDPTEKGQIFSQLRDLYDGFAGGSYGTGADKDYRGKAPQMLIGCTDAVAEEFLFHQELGTRELIYRLNTDSSKARRRAMELAKRGLFDTAKKECKQVVSEYLRTNSVALRKIEVPDAVDHQIEKLTDFLVYFRAKGKVDNYTGELISTPSLEKPTRVAMQLIQLYKALKLLDENYPDERALEIIRHVVACSGDAVTLKIYEFLKGRSIVGSSTTEVSEELRLGYKTVYSRLNTLWALDLIECDRLQEGERHTRYWKVNDNVKIVTPSELAGNEW